MKAAKVAALAAISTDADGMTMKGSLPDALINIGFIISPHIRPTFSFF